MCTSNEEPNHIARRCDSSAPIVQPSVSGSIDYATLELLAAWRVADATDNPDDVQAAEKELAEFKSDE